MIIALAGRRIDDPNTTQPRFPAKNADAVKQQIHAFLRSQTAHGLVSAAACGADILALEVAGELRLRRRVVLPFDQTAFRSSSVVDRGGDWGECYDRIIADVEKQGDLVEFAHDRDNDQIYFTGNLEILNQTQWLAQQMNTAAAALVVWDGKSRGASDVTEHFRQTAMARGMNVTEVRTLDLGPH